MKNSWNLLIFAFALILVQSCGKKSSENTEEYAATETPAISARLTPEERRAKIEKDKADRAEDKAEHAQDKADEARDEASEAKDEAH